VWVALNAAGTWRFDPYPFEFLNFALAVEPVLLSTIVLVAQNRQGREAAEQAELHLQVGLLAEQEATEMLEMLRAVRDRGRSAQKAVTPRARKRAKRAASRSRRPRGPTPNARPGASGQSARSFGPAPGG
jgi:uncharacterized membrane protein